MRVVSMLIIMVGMLISCGGRDHDYGEHALHCEGYAHSHRRHDFGEHARNYCGLLIRTVAVIMSLVITRMITVGVIIVILVSMLKVACSYAR